MGATLSASNETNHSLLNSNELTELLPSTVIDFMERMLRNGIDNIELMDFILCGLIVLFGLELISTIVLNVAGCKWGESRTRYYYLIDVIIYIITHLKFYRPYGFTIYIFVLASQISKGIKSYPSEGSTLMTSVL